MPFVRSYPPSNVRIVLIKSMTRDERLKTDLGRFGIGPLKGVKEDVVEAPCRPIGGLPLISMLVVHHIMCVAAPLCYHLVSGVTPHFFRLVIVGPH